ncbi:unnamed protein product [Linum tenue]|uniref:SANTA domain-containing protein n=1 Tax=Linum tenue TaxID=586396 RepID=A0AAV0LHT4_9ROSI|nr:unnamed protein product [Linum tenue]
MDAALPTGNQSPSSAVGRRPTCNKAVSYFKKTVTLQDWWLIKADQDYEGKRLGVAGFPPSGQRGLREFRSAPIIKTYDVFTLETADGVTVLIHGFLNRTRTVQNGFPIEATNSFLLGFPFYWEHCAKRWVQDAYSNEVHMTKTSADPDMQSAAAESTPTADKDNSNDEVVKDGPYPPSLNFDIKALKRCPLHSPITRSRSSACEKVITKKHSSVEGTCDTVYHDGSSSSPERIVDKLESNKSKKRSARNLNSKEPVLSLRYSTFTSPSAPEEDSGFERSDVDHLNVLELNQKKPAKSYDSPRYGYALRSGVINRSTTSLLQVPELTSGFNGEKESGASASPDAGKFSHPELDSNNESIRTFVYPNIDERVDLKKQGNSRSKRRKSRSKLASPKYLSKKKASRYAVRQNKELPSESAKPHLDEEGKRGDVHKRTIPSSSKVKNCKSEVGASRRTRNSTRKERHEKLNVKAGDSSGTTKVKKRIFFETPVTPKTVEGKSRSRLHSPESLNLKRSRSGRLLLPAVRFCGNQIPVNDTTGNVTGILEQLDTVQPYRGTRSEPPKRKRKTR